MNEASVAFVVTMGFSICTIAHRPEARATFAARRTSDFQRPTPNGLDVGLTYQIRSARKNHEGAKTNTKNTEARGRRTGTNL
jgi:hypothetical protein